MKIDNLKQQNQETVHPAAEKSTNFFRPAAIWLGTLFLALPGGAARADGEVRWRSDYNAARKEAVEKNRPLLLDFGTENCVWCRKLDATTFRDGTIIEALNEHFIPLKVDGYRHAALVQILQIHSYPTIVLAAPDGKILATLEGYLEATRFHEQLQRVLASVSNPEWMARDYQEATRAITSADYPRALALLKAIAEDGKDRPVQIKSRQLLQDLEQQAAGRLARARQLDDKGQTSEALNLVSDLLRTFPGTSAAMEGGQLLTALAGKPEMKEHLRKRQARDLLALAREDYRTQQFFFCLDRCETLSTSYADLPEGTEARQLAAEIKNNPAWMQQACDTLSERLGTLYVSLAETYLKKGQPQQAEECLKRVLASFPNTRHADLARVRLATLQDRPTFQAEFKKQ